MHTEERSVWDENARGRPGAFLLLSLLPSRPNHTMACARSGGVPTDHTVAYEVAGGDCAATCERSRAPA